MSDMLCDIVKHFSQQPVLVIGDMVADVYLEGKISRISREAPVLVLEHAGETIVPGGAANAVHNVATLGGAVFALGVIGSDSAGCALNRILNAKGVNTDGLVVDVQRPTITKTRVMAGGLATVRQQVVRIDREAKEPLAPELEERLIASFIELLPKVKAVILSDYGVQTISPKLKELAIRACREQKLPCLVDSRYDILSFTGATIVKQNEAELAAVTGRQELSEEELVQAGRELLDRMNAEVIMLTRGPEGMSIFEKNAITHIPVTNVAEVIDVSGAGDTAVAAMALALAAAAGYRDAAAIANYAAGCVVRKFGTATTTQQEVSEAIGAAK